MAAKSAVPTNFKTLMSIWMFHKTLKVGLKNVFGGALSLAPL